MNLYFIALLCDEKTAHEITALKHDFKNRFNSSHALKAPPHITLQMPFRMDERKEEIIFKALSKFTSKQNPISVKLNGFDCFEPRVIYADVENSKDICHLYTKLIPYLKEIPDIAPKWIKPTIHPHCTIATRDLTPEMFNKAWDEYRNKEFKSSFDCNALTLLKHNGKFWEIYKQFKFT